MSRIIDILDSPWAILPAKLEEIQEIYRIHRGGGKIDIQDIELRLGRPLANEQESYAVEGGVAILPIDGVLGKRMNLFTQISGGASTQLIEKNFAEAVDDPNVHSIVLAIDSPGGTVDGTQTLADAIYSARGRKPIVTHASGMMGSAAMWIGAAADSIYIADDTTAAGSIGVIAKHVDYSQREVQAGIKVTEITAGKYKRIASEHAPLTQEGRAVIQDQVDHIYSIFVDNVAKLRGVSVEKVLADMADGRLFIGQQAIKAGLVDGVSTLSSLVSALNGKRMTERTSAARAVLNLEMEATRG